MYLTHCFGSGGGGTGILLLRARVAALPTRGRGSRPGGGGTTGYVAAAAAPDPADGVAFCSSIHKSRLSCSTSQPGLSTLGGGGLPLPSSRGSTISEPEEAEGGGFAGPVLHVVVEGGGGAGAARNHGGVAGAAAAELAP